MAWVEPKTNWKNGDAFNLSPDYDRIKENIEYLQRLYRVQGTSLGTFTLSDIPLVSFFNDIVINTELISPYPTLRHYSTGGCVWGAKDLNDIEGIHLYAYTAYNTALICDDNGYCDDDLLI